MFKRIRIFLTIQLICIFYMLSSCTTAPSMKEYKRRDLKLYYSQSGIQKYFLPYFPNIFHFSQKQNCKINNNIRYSNLPLLRKSFFFNYSNAILFQLAYNHQLSLKLKKIHLKPLRPSDDEQIFFELIDKVQGDLSIFIMPKYKRIHLVEIDSYLNLNTSHRQLLKLFKSKRFGKGLPVVISFCKSRTEIYSFLRKYKLLRYGTKIISNEMMNIYGANGHRYANFGIDLNQFFGIDKQLYIFQKSKEANRALRGKIKIVKY